MDAHQKEPLDEERPLTLDKAGIKAMPRKRIERDRRIADRAASGPCHPPSDLPSPPA